MKKITLLLAAFCLIASSAIAQPAQLAKGNLMVGVTSTMALGGSEGSEFLGLSFVTEKHQQGSGQPEAEYKMTTYNFLPKGGYFFMDNLVAGLEVVLTGYSEKAIDDGDTWKETTIGIGPFVRYYYPLEKFYPFAEVEAVFGSYKEVWMGDEEDKEGFTLFGFSLGAAFPLADKITFDAAAGYLRTAYKWEGVEGGEDGKYIYGGLGIRMGFSIYLPL
jgi:outer membrane protein